MALAALLCFAVLACPVLADNPPDADPNSGKPGDEASDELLLFRDVPIVVSAARTAQPANWLSVPVSVITAEDIHYSGATTIPEVLQFAPGMDVLRLDRNRYAVGVRGLHDQASDRLQTLIDGRIADSEVFGGADWLRLPVLMEDIKRIEIVRGPAGAAWGANAFTGVVNIITKEPEDCLGWLAATRWNHFGDSYNHLRWAAKAGKWSWRVSLGYAHHETSEEAIDDDNFLSRDFSRDWRFDSKAIYRPSERTKWSAGLAYSNLETGDYDYNLHFPMRDGRTVIARVFARVDHTFLDGSTGYLQYFHHYDRTHTPPFMKEWIAKQNDLEGQLNFALAKDHRASVGGNFRWSRINSHSPGIQDHVFVGEPFDEFWLGLFARDHWKLTDRFALEGQLRGDWYSETQVDWSGRLTGLYALDEKARHIVRLSSAKAFRAPQVGYRTVAGTRMPHPFVPGLFIMNMLPASGLDKNEETWSLEAGYTGKLTPHLTVRVDAYYQRFERLIGAVHFPDPLAAGRIFNLIDDLAGADAFGAETEVELKGKAGKISAWYAYHAFQEDERRQMIRAYLPARHKVGLTGRLFLPQGWTLNANYKYGDTTPYDPGGNRQPGRPLHRLDLTVAKEIAKGHGEIVFGVSDVLNTTRDPVFAQGATSAHPTPGRTFFARVQWKF